MGFVLVLLQTHHITGYQVFALPRMPEDPENGNVRLVLQGGDMCKQPGSPLDSAGSEWEELRPEGLKMVWGLHH